MLAVGIDGEWPVGLDRAPRRRARSATSSVSRCSPLNTLAGRAGSAACETLPLAPDLEQAVVGHGVGRGEHAAAVGLACSRRRPSSRVTLDALAVDREREGGGLPGRQRAERRVGVDEPALDALRLVRDAVRVRVEAAAGDAEEAHAVRLADVDLRGSCRRRRCPPPPRRRRGCPTTRAKSLPRPPGMIPSVDAGVRRARRRPGRSARRRSSRSRSGRARRPCAPPRDRGRCSGSGPADARRRRRRAPPAPAARASGPPAARRGIDQEEVRGLAQARRESIRAPPVSACRPTQ